MNAEPINNINYYKNLCNFGKIKYFSDRQINPQVTFFCLYLLINIKHPLFSYSSQSSFHTEGSDLFIRMLHKIDKNTTINLLLNTLQNQEKIIKPIFCEPIWNIISNKNSPFILITNNITTFESKAISNIVAHLISIQNDNENFESYTIISSIQKQLENTIKRYGLQEISFSITTAPREVLNHLIEFNKQLDNVLKTFNKHSNTAFIGKYGTLKLFYNFYELDKFNGSFYYGITKPSGIVINNYHKNNGFQSNIYFEWMQFFNQRLNEAIYHISNNENLHYNQLIKEIGVINNKNKITQKTLSISSDIIQNKEFLEQILLQRFKNQSLWNNALNQKEYCAQNNSNTTSSLFENLMLNKHSGSIKNSILNYLKKSVQIVDLYEQTQKNTWQQHHKIIDVSSKRQKFIEDADTTE